MHTSFLLSVNYIINPKILAIDYFNSCFYKVKDAAVTEASLNRNQYGSLWPFLDLQRRHSASVLSLGVIKFTASSAC